MSYMLNFGIEANNPKIYNSDLFDARVAIFEFCD